MQTLGNTAFLKKIKQNILCIRSIINETHIPNLGVAMTKSGVPIMKKLGWYLDLRKKDPEKPLPRWMLKAIGLKRERD